MKLIKDNSYEIVRLYINQIGITIFSLVLYTAIGFVEDADLNFKIRIILSVFATLFYFALIYSAAWEYGAKDKIRIDTGKISPVRAKGLVMSLVANLPNFLLAASAVLCMVVYTNTAAEGFYTAFGVLNLIMRFCSAMYLGIIQGIFSFITDVNSAYLWQSVGFFALPLLSVAVTHLAYTLGTKDVRILSLFSSRSSSSGKSGISK